MNLDVTDKIAKAIVEKIITPIVYMMENEDSLELICYCDHNIEMKDIYDAENAVEAVCGKRPEIIDIRELNESDRVDIIREAEVIYAENPIVEQMFVMSAVEGFRIAMEQRTDMLRRYRESGSFYLQ